MAFSLTSEAFEDGESIPRRFTCEGDNVSPPLVWSGAPRETRSFFLLMDDPDARSFRHWVVFDIPGHVTRLEENLPPGRAGRMLANDAGHPRYDGPCPPRGDGHHRYRFTLLALDVSALHFRGDRHVYVKEALSSHVLATTTLNGLFGRR